MALQSQTFADFSHAKWEAFVAKIATDTSVNLTTNTGHVKHGSFEFDYAYNPDTHVLTITCTHKPLFIPAHVILNGISDEILELKPLVAPPPPVTAGEPAVVAPVPAVAVPSTSTFTPAASTKPSTT